MLATWMSSAISWGFSASLRRSSSLTLRFLRSLSQKMGETVPERAQTTNRVMLVRPSCFNYNPQTAVSNDFQSEIEGMNRSQVQEQAVREFESLVEKLKEINVSLTVFEDTVRKSPDAVFPNNWVSFHSQDGASKVVIYPMMSENRRHERNRVITDYWTKALNATLVDYTHYESQSKFLEGTGSMVLDRVNRIAYSCTSPRTDVQVLENFCSDFGYTPTTFCSVLSPQNDGKLQDVYHTNVVMSVGDGFAVVCLESISDRGERERLVQSLENSNKEIVAISGKQVCEFAGNVLQLVGLDGRKHLVMSSRAHSAFTPEQLAVFQRHCDSVVPVPLNVIERAGGGGVRCMIAEVFPPLP